MQEVETQGQEHTIKEPMTICNGMGGLSVNKGLNTSWFSFPTSTGASPEMLAITLEFPYGLYDFGFCNGFKDVKIAVNTERLTAGNSRHGQRVQQIYFPASIIEISMRPSPKKVQLQTDENFLARV